STEIIKMCLICVVSWDNVSCWPSAAVGDVLTLRCPTPFLLIVYTQDGDPAVLHNRCDSGSIIYDSISRKIIIILFCVCLQLVFYKAVQILSNLGHSLSIITLLTSTIIICLFRRLHCMRNYIHLNLFVSFILRAVAVLVKDTLLFSYGETTDCSRQPSLVGCKTSLIFFQYFILANFFWLLVEGLYLHMLLLVLPTYSFRLSIYMLIGWGIPLVFIVAWIICRIYMEDTGCWEMNNTPIPNRVINWPIMASIIINFILFISIIRILVQKLRSCDVGGNDQSQYKRLAKSTLLLIPLFGVYYVVFFYLMEPENENVKQVKIFFDLGLGSFQGLIVAVLYCFLNSEVQSELRRTWKCFSVKRCVGQDFRLHSVNQNGTESSTQCSRNSRAQSILQTEITGL
uniref:Vasoactive intestinal polypeptide receptor 2 n=1 Tax=Oreochromis niloticus TaxID=8128 RepID=A0A669C577_ORENI